MKLSIKNKKIGYKNKHNTRKKNKKIFKMVGGQIEDIKKDEEYTMKDLKKMEDYLKNTIKEKEDIESKETEKKILENVESVAAPLVDTTKELVNDVTETVTPYINSAIVGTTEVVGELIDMNPEDKEEVARKLDDIKEVINDPVLKEKATELIEDVAENAALVIKAAEPATEELTKVATKNFEIAGKEIGKASINIGMNMFEEIPGIGAILALTRSLDTAAKAGLKVADATSEVVEVGSEAVKETINNLEELKEKSKKEMENMNQNMSQNISDNIKLNYPEKQSQPQTQTQQGGRTFKKKQNDYKEIQALKTKLISKIGGSIREFKETTMNPYKIINKKYTKKYKHNTKRKTKKMNK